MKYLFLLLLFSLPAHAVYIQIHMNRPLLAYPNVIVSTYYDNDLIGPYHVAIYQTDPQGLYDLLYMESYESVIEAHQSHQDAMAMAARMFPQNQESPEIYQMLVQNYANEVTRTVITEPPQIQLPEAVTQHVANRTLPIPGEDEKSAPKVLVKRYRRLGTCKEEPDPLYDEDDDEDEDEEEDDLFESKNIPKSLMSNFKTVTISGKSVSFFK